MKPVITLADVMQATAIPTGQLAEMSYQNALGIDMSIRVRLKFSATGQIAIACPNCGDDCIGLNYHPAGRR